jgi:hypothetical protein
MEALSKKQLTNTIIFLVVKVQSNGETDPVSSFEDEEDAKEFARFMGNRYRVWQLPYNHN